MWPSWLLLLRVVVVLLALSPQRAYSDDEVLATGAGAGHSPGDVLSLLGIEDPATRAVVQGLHAEDGNLEGYEGSAEVKREERASAANTRKRSGGYGAAPRAPTAPAPQTGVGIRRQPPDNWGSVQPQLRALFDVLLPVTDALAAVSSCEAAVAALTAAERQVPAVGEQYDLADEEALIKALLALMPVAVAAPEPTVAYHAMIILDKRITDRPGSPPAYRSQIATMWTELSTLLTRDASFIAADRSRWYGADRRARLPPDFNDAHPSGFGYQLAGSDTIEHTRDHRSLPARRCASFSLSATSTVILYAEARCHSCFGCKAANSRLLLLGVIRSQKSSCRTEHTSLNELLIQH